MRFALLLLPIALLTACPYERCDDPDGVREVVLPRGGGEVGPAGVIETLRLCPSTNDEVEYTVLAEEITGGLEILQGGRFRFPNLRRASSIGSEASADLSFEVLTTASDMNLAGGMVDAPSLENVDYLTVWRGELRMPQLTTTERLSIGSYAVATFNAPRLARAAQIYINDNSELEAIDLPSLTSTDQLVARGNPLLRDCALRALAAQASVPADAITLEGNSSAPCD